MQEEVIALNIHKNEDSSVVVTDSSIYVHDLRNQKFITHFAGFKISQPHFYSDYSQNFTFRSKRGYNHFFFNENRFKIYGINDSNYEYLQYVPLINEYFVLNKKKLQMRYLN
ncbi:MAG: hypothetical protein MHMPM18_004244 [Marteilia pararefringens]